MVPSILGKSKDEWWTMGKGRCGLGRKSNGKSSLGCARDVLSGSESQHRRTRRKEGEERGEEEGGGRCIHKMPVLTRDVEMWNS